VRALDATRVRRTSGRLRLSRCTFVAMPSSLGPAQVTSGAGRVWPQRGPPFRSCSLEGGGPRLSTCGLGSRALGAADVRPSSRCLPLQFLRKIACGVSGRQASPLARAAVLFPLPQRTAGLVSLKLKRSPCSSSPAISVPSRGTTARSDGSGTGRSLRCASGVGTRAPHAADAAPVAGGRGERRRHSRR
jgi:hypothetical protein